MSSVPLYLPLKASEAAALADLVIQQTEQRSVDDELRSRLSGRVPALGLTTVVPYMGSLQADPVHSNVYYLAVDSSSGNEPAPLLLRMSPATAPASSIFPDSILVGRMRPGGGREIVVNAIPFGPADERNLLNYAEQIDPAFLPRAMGAQTAITVLHSNPAQSAQPAFEAFVQIHRTLRRNLCAHASELAPLVWAAIRTGWRQGYAIESVSRLIVDAADIGIVNRQLDLEVSFRNEPMATTPEQIAAALGNLRHRGRPAQFVAPKLGGASLAELAAAARQFNAVMSLYSSEVPAEELRVLGRINYKVDADGPDLTRRIVSVAENLRA